jgi:hypothetical protein
MGVAFNARIYNLTVVILEFLIALDRDFSEANFTCKVVSHETLAEI